MTAALARRRTEPPNDRAAGPGTDPAPRQTTPRRPRLVPLPDYHAPTVNGNAETATDRATATGRTPTPPGFAATARSSPTANHGGDRSAASASAPIPTAPPIAHYHVPAHPGLQRQLPSRNPLPPRRRRFEVHRISESTGPAPGDETSSDGAEPAGFGPGVPAALLAAAQPATAARTMPRALPSALSTGTMLGRALVEALSGRRPIEQLRRYCATGVFTGLQELPMLGGRRRTHLVNTWVCEPAAKVAEVSVAFRCAGFTRAMAFRMVATDGNWQITELQVG